MGVRYTGKTNVTVVPGEALLIVSMPLICLALSCILMSPLPGLMTALSKPAIICYFHADLSCSCSAFVLITEHLLV